MVPVSVLLSVLFVSGALASCSFTPVLFITAPKMMEALSGSCLQIPCNFRAEPEERLNDRSTMFAVWIKSDPRFAQNPNNVIFNSSGTVNTYTISITGDLSKKNCTTLFPNLITTISDQYFFRIETESFKGAASCDPIQINVADSPPSPRIEISGELKEKESVAITCSASIPCPHSPPELTWNLQKDPHSKTEKNADGTFTTKIQKNVTLSDKHDGTNITCSARYPVNEGKDVKTAEGKMTLTVSYAPKDTLASISPSGRVPAGSWVNLTCSSRATPPVSRLTWFKKSTDGPVKVAEGGFYSFNATDGGVYYCVATNDVGDQHSSEIHLTIGEGEPLQWQPVLGGIIGIVVLICLIVIVWRFESTCSTTQQCQRQTGEELAVEESASKTEEENIHYGEIAFSNQRPSPDSLQDRGQQQDMVYAQVKVSKTAGISTQAADSSEDLYAKVKKK